MSQDPNAGHDTWEKISSIFADALQTTTAGRDAFLRDACQGSQSIEDEVRRLLEEHERASGGFLADFALTETIAGDPAEAGRACRIGDLLSGRFRIVRLLGAGGMGEVYEAFDSELRQAVAVKMLRSSRSRDPAMVERFRAEVLRSRQITHPNVARVYDLFTHRREDGGEICFFTMELLEGEPLSRWLETHGPVAPEAALPLIEQMSAALHAAHSVGIVHRDFKPGNVFVSGGDSATPKATVTDFGIAVQFGAIGEPTATGSPAPSVASLLAGTPAYMAPERLLGAAGTPAVDIYALGLVAFEMLTGQRAYDSKSPLACALRKAADADPRLFDETSDVPASWVEAIHRAVRREPEQRFADPLDFAAAVSPVSGGEAAGRSNRWGVVWPAAALAIILAASVVILDMRTASESQSHPATLAVLPFVNVGAEPQSVYLSDGVAEGLIRSLNAFPKLRVTPQKAAAAYGEQRKPPAEIAKALGADMLLAGSFRQSGHGLHLSANLRGGADGKPVWAHDYDCDMEQLLAVQADITKQVATRMKLGAAQPKRTTVPTSNADAYDLYLRGQYLWNTRTREGVLKAIELFGRAVSLDDKFALADAATADAYIILADYGWMSPAEVLPKAQSAIQRAVALNADAAETQAALGLFHMLIDWDQPAAERAFQRAQSLDPTLVPAHHWYANYLERARRMDEALREAQEARRLDPTTPPTLLIVGWIRYYRREYPAAIEIGKQAVELYPSVPQSHELLAMSYASSGQTDLALKENAEAVRLTTDPAVALRRRAEVLSRIPGHENEAREAARKLEAISWDRQAAYMVPIYAALHDGERMYHWADRALQIHDTYLLMANVDLPLDAFRNEPRFQQILHRMGY